jgi:hypothetical protein
METPLGAGTHLKTASFWAICPLGSSHAVTVRVDPSVKVVVLDADPLALRTRV